jgi:hypothetical protein
VEIGLDELARGSAWSSSSNCKTSQAQLISYKISQDWDGARLRQLMSTTMRRAQSSQPTKELFGWVVTKTKQEEKNPVRPKKMC